MDWTGDTVSTVDSPVTTQAILAKGSWASALQTVSQLGLVEGLRLARDPPVLVGLGFATSSAIYAFYGWAPVLDRVSASLTLLVGFIAAGTLLSAVTMAQRLSNVNGLEEALVAPADQRVRVGGALVAIGGPVLVTFFFELTVLALLMTQRPAAAIVWGEVGIGVSVVALTGVIGVAVGVVVSSRIAGPIALLMVAALNAALATNLLNELVYSTGREGVNISAPGLTSWWAPIAGYDLSLPYSLQLRPTALHLIYLLGLIGAVACGVLSIIRGKTRRILWTSGLLVFGSVTVVVGMAQASAPGVSQQERILQTVMTADRTCETHSGVTYCPYPEFSKWVEDWSSVVGSIVDILPEQVRAGGLEIRQFDTRFMQPGLFGYGLMDPFELMDPFDTDTIMTHTWWARSSPLTETGVFDPYGLGLAIGTWAVGLPVNVLRPTADQEETACNASDQARAIVAQWLAGQATPDTENYLRGVIDDPAILPVFGDELPDWGEAFYEYPTPFVGRHLLLDRQVAEGGLESIRYFLREQFYSRQLLDRPRGDVAALIALHWDMLTDPETTTRQALQIFGLEEVETPIDRTDGTYDWAFHGGLRCE